MTALASMLNGEIRAGEFQGMAALDAWTYEDLKADIEKNGVEVPIVVNQDYVIVDGHHRWKIAQELGICDTVPVEIHTYGSRAATEVASVRLNVNRRQITKEQRNQYVIRMRQVLGMTQREVGERVGLSRQRIDQIEKSSPKQETSTGAFDPLDTAKAKAANAKGKGRTVVYKFTEAEAVAVQVEVERLRADGLTIEAISESVGIAPSAVRRRLPRARPEPEPDAAPLHEQIAASARQGMNAKQIAAEVGRSEGLVRRKARENGIDIPADRASHRKTIDADAAMGRAVEQLADTLYAFKHIPMTGLDRERVQEWSRSLDESARAIRTLIRQLNQLTKEQDQL